MEFYAGKATKAEQLQYLLHEVDKIAEEYAIELVSNILKDNPKKVKKFFIGNGRYFFDNMKDETIQHCEGLFYLVICKSEIKILNLEIIKICICKSQSIV